MADTSTGGILPSYGQGERIATALEVIAEQQGGSIESKIEYGVRFTVGASSSAGERVIRQNGVISAWDITFTQNINNDNANCPFSAIDLFSPPLWTDAAGNVFRRFSRFYYSHEYIGNYEYYFVCRRKINANYKLPKAFLPNWQYVDIGAYEGGTETIDGTTYLNSKSGSTLAGTITRTVAFNRAKAWHSYLGITDLTKETYLITTMSEITEIWQPLLYIQLASKNSDAGYLGHISDVGETTNLIMPGQTDVINGLHGTVADDGMHSFKMLGIENMWGNQWKHVLDVTILDYVPYVCDDLSNWTDTSTPDTDAAFASANYSVCESDGHVTAMGTDAQHPEIVLPTAVGGSNSTYYADYYYIDSGARSVLFGGSLSHGRRCGMSYWYLYSTVGISNWDRGARLSHRSL